MKFKRFVLAVLDNLDNSILDLKTVRSIIRLVYDCLSNREKDKYYILFKRVWNQFEKQTNIDDMVYKNKIQELELELRLLKQ